MEALLELAPRNAGADPGEVTVEFTEGASLHEIDACAGTCICSNGTYTCPNTGKSFL